MLFGLFNAPISFIRLMNHIFRPFVGGFFVAYFDDNLIYTKTEEEHASYLNQVVQVLKKEKVYGNLKKCTFFTQKVTFFEHIIIANGI